MSLQLAPGLVLPDEAVSEAFGILGQRGAGKSNVGVVMAEEMHAAGLPWVAIDPKGDWWGIRAAGTGPGLPVAVLGGLHGDIPLVASAGDLVADMVVDENLTAVIDVSDFTLADRHRFLLLFAQRLYHRHRHEPQRRHVFLEEAHEYLPQSVTSDRAAVKEAIARIPLMGRSFGLGSTTMSQRSARLHKDVLTQVGTLIAMRTTGPQDRRAIGEWVKEHAVASSLLDSLPELGDGEAWVWSPRFLGCIDRVQVRRRTTFDSGATPIGIGTRAPATLADIDLPALTARMAATVERAKADDPKALRTRIRELEQQLAERPAAEPETVYVPALAEGQAELLWTTAQDIITALQRVSAPTTDPSVKGRVADGPRGVPEASREAPRPAGGDLHSVAAARPVTAARPAREGDAPLGKAERLILAALAQHGDRTPVQVAILTGYSANGGGFRNALGRLRSGGLVTGRDRVELTDAGRAATSDIGPLPTGRALVEHWLGQLNRAERLVLEALVDAWPRSLTVAQVAETAGYEASGGGFRNALGKLRTLQLIEGRADLVAAAALAEHP